MRPCQNDMISDTYNRSLQLFTLQENDNLKEAISNLLGQVNNESLVSMIESILENSKAIKTENVYRLILALLEL